MDQADVVLSKGQGNYEALWNERPDVFFAFKVKCPVVAGLSGPGSGQFGVLARNLRRDRARLIASCPKKRSLPFFPLRPFLFFLRPGPCFSRSAILTPTTTRRTSPFSLLDATGRPVTLEGDIHLEFFPWFGVRTGPVRIGNAKGFEPDEFLEISSVYLRVKVLPFFQKKLVVDRVFLNDPVLDLRRRRDGGVQLGRPRTPPAIPGNGPDSGFPRGAAVFQGRGGARADP